MPNISIENYQNLLKLLKIKYLKNPIKDISSDFTFTLHAPLLQLLQQISYQNGQMRDQLTWHHLFDELKKIAHFQKVASLSNSSTDAFSQYAKVYDELIGKPCLNDFIAAYLSFFTHQFQFKFQNATLFSIGCGTGLVEAYIQRQWNMTSNQILGIDLSAAMVQEAQKRISAIQADFITFDPKSQQWDCCVSGLNVFQYLPHQLLENAIQKIPTLLRPGGYFIGDFITPDHIRWYPNILYSSDNKAISLRIPRLIEEKGFLFQESEIINFHWFNDSLEVYYSGKHRRFLPPIHRVRQYFEAAFGEQVYLFDAVTLKPVERSADTCTSTRYVLVAQKKAI